MDMTRIDETVEAGATGVWTIDNAMPLPHNFHVHAMQFQVLRVGSEPPSVPVRQWISSAPCLWAGSRSRSWNWPTLASS
ncbi:multicopper oxidase domain-containing protein [Cryobacterium ruanii]